MDEEKIPQDMMTITEEERQQPLAPPREVSLTDLLNLRAGWDERHQNPPNILYHYTSAQGLLGMLATKRLWATNVGFLNDPSEMRYAARLMREVMTEEANKLKTASPAAQQSYVGKLKEHMIEKIYGIPDLKGWIETLLKTFEQEGDAYMTCFCEQRDLLGQWRGYGATGGGYAVGFSAKQVGPTGADTEGMHLRRVIYDPPTQRRIVRDWLRTFLAFEQTLRQTAHTHFFNLKSPDPGAKFEEVYQAGRAETQQLLQQGQQVLERFLAECLICFKDPAYAEEQEWRVIQFGRSAPEIKFRPSGALAVPYVELNLIDPASKFKDRLPVKSITYGPTLEPEMTEKSLRMLLTRHGYIEPPVSIKRSSIPFRHYN